MFYFFSNIIILFVNNFFNYFLLLYFLIKFNKIRINSQIYVFIHYIIYPLKRLSLILLGKDYSSIIIPMFLIFVQMILNNIFNKNLYHLNWHYILYSTIINIILNIIWIYIIILFINIIFKLFKNKKLNDIILLTEYLTNPIISIFYKYFTFEKKLMKCKLLLFLLVLYLILNSCLIA